MSLSLGVHCRHRLATHGLCKNDHSTGWRNGLHTFLFLLMFVVMLGHAHSSWGAGYAYQAVERLKAVLMARLIQSLTSTGCGKLAGSKRQQPQSLQWDQQSLNRLGARAIVLCFGKGANLQSVQETLAVTARQCPASF